MTWKGHGVIFLPFFQIVHYFLKPVAFLMLPEADGLTEMQEAGRLGAWWPWHEGPFWAQPLLNSVSQVQCECLWLEFQIFHEKL